MFDGEDYDIDDPGEKPKRSFRESVFRWWGIIGTFFCVAIPIAYTAVMQKVFKVENVTFVFWSSIFLALTLLVASVFGWFWMRKKIYGIKWGEGGRADRDIYPAGEPKKKIQKNIPLDPDATDDEVVKAMERIRKRRRK